MRVTCSLVPSLDLVWAACDMQLLPVAGDNNAWCMQVVGYFVRDDRRPPTRQTVTVVRQSGPQPERTTALREHRRILAPAVAPAPGRIESEEDNVRAWDGVASRIATRLQWFFSGRIATSGETSSPKSLSCRPWI